MRARDVAHVREQIAADPERYANPAKLSLVADALLREVGADPERVCPLCAGAVERRGRVCRRCVRRLGRRLGL